MRTSVLLVLCLIAAACGGSQTTAASQPAKGAGWKTLTPAQRKDLMRTAVLPKMAPLFHDFDPQRFAKVTCGTCHPCTRSGQTGYVQLECVSCHKPDGIPDKPAMPSTALPKLSTADGYKLHNDRAPKTVQFMRAKVVPEMVRLLGEDTSFGCMSCHTKAD